MIKSHFFLLFLFLSLSALPAHAQRDSIRLVGKLIDSLKTTPHSAQKATLYAAILPGLGQIYNRKNAFWKVPIVVGGGVALGFSIAWNNQKYIQFRHIYLDKLYQIPSKSPFSLLPIGTIESQMKYYRRNRDFLIIISVGAYGLQVLDAFVEGHLKTFNVDDNLALRIAPYSENVAGQALSGISLKLSFR